MADFATEGGHWYKPDGTPFYTVIGKTTGKERPATIRDARGVGAWPGVTSVIDRLAKPGLIAWIKREVAYSAATAPYLDGETTEQWMTRIMGDADERARAARERGTEVHGALERAHRGDIDPALAQWITEVNLLVMHICGVQMWKEERSYAHPLGYGCKIDLHSDEWVIDYKGKENFDDVKLYREHWMQLAANRRAAGLPNARAGIVFFLRQKPEVRFVEATPVELRKGLAMFDGLLDCWWAENETPEYCRDGQTVMEHR